MEVSRSYQQDRRRTACDVLLLERESVYVRGESAFGDVNKTDVADRGKYCELQWKCSGEDRPGEIS